MVQRRVLTKEELTEVFRINAAGELERLDGRYKEEIWTVVKCVPNTKAGYCAVQYKGVEYYHRIVWTLINGTIEDINTYIDHLNGNKLDNRVENLRLVTKRENAQNTYKHRAGKLVGCHFDKKSNKWQARVIIQGKHVGIGSYDTELEAHSVYNKALTMLDKSVEEIQKHFGVAQFTSKFKGVTYIKRDNKWQAFIRIDGKSVKLGNYCTELEASEIYLKAVELKEHYINNNQFRALIKGGNNEIYSSTV